MKRLQAADKLLGWASCVALQPLRWWRARRSAPTAPARDVLLVKFWGIGSLQLLTPAVATLRRRHPDARITLLTLRENEEFARLLGIFDDVLTLDVRAGGWIAIFARILGLVRRLRALRFDHVYDFEFFTRFSAFVALATGAPHTSGFAAPNVWRGGFHTRTVPFNRYWHVARNFRALAGGENGHDIAPGSLDATSVSPADTSSVRAKLAARGARASYVVLNPNAGSLSLERRWPAANFAELARSLASDDEHAVVFVGAKGEREHVRGIVAQLADLPAGRIVDLAGELSIGELAALLQGAAALVSNDSGPMHVGAALGTPTIGLFGPETPIMYRPLGARTVAMWEPPVCSPCINVHENKVSNCIHGRPECLVNLTVADVLAETRTVLWERVLVPSVRLPRRASLYVLRAGDAPPPHALEREAR